MKKIIAYFMSVIFVFSSALLVSATEIEDESLDSSVEQEVDDTNYELPEFDEDVIAEELDDFEEIEEDEDIEREKDVEENTRYNVITEAVDQEVYDYMFSELNGFYDILGDILEDKGMDIRDAYIGKPIKVDLCPDDFQQYIFPVFIEDKVVGTILIEKIYHDDDTEGEFSIGIGDVFWDIITYNTGNLYLFKYENSIFASDNSGIQEIYGHSYMADSPEVQRQVRFTRSANTIDISQETVSLSEVREGALARDSIDWATGKKVLNIKWVGIDRDIAETCWAASMACIWEHIGGKLIPIKDWCYSVHGNTCLNRGYCIASTPKDERAAAYALIGKDKVYVSSLKNISYLQVGLHVRDGEPCYSLGVNPAASKEHAVVIYGYNTLNEDNIRFYIMDTNYQSEAYTLTRKYDFYKGYFISGNYTFYTYLSLILRP